MTPLHELAETVKTAWSKTQNNLDAFTALAHKALAYFKYDWDLEKLNTEVERWLLASPVLPKQVNLHNAFGQPPVTIFNNEHFVVDLYFWVDFDTSIHSHGFRGAFRVLHGESLQETFHTKLVRNISEDIRVVDMSKIERERLKAGDVRTIAPGMDLTHRVIHLANPTVTLCVKTINEPELKQWTYLPNGLAIQKQNLPTDLLKKIYYYQYLFGCDETQAAGFLNGLLKGLSASAQIHLYEDVAGGTLELREEVVDKIAETIVNLHEKSEWWPFYEQAHLSQMDEIRFEHLQDPEERLAAHYKNTGYLP